MSALMCSRCGFEIVPGSPVEFIGDVDLEQVRILSDDDVLIVHATCPSPPSTDELLAKYGPPDDLAEGNPDVTNLNRAMWGGVALAAFREAVRSDDDLATAAADLVCDVMHLLQFHGVDPEDVMTNGWRHFQAEVGLGYER